MMTETIEYLCTDQSFCLLFRMIVEHLVFFKLKDGYTQEQENDMYKGLWSFKDRYNSIMSMSLGEFMESIFAVA